MAEVRVSGAAEWDQTLRRIGSALPAGLRNAAARSADVVAADARPRIPFGPGQGGHARSSIDTVVTGVTAQVSGGGSRFAYFPWLDFGGSVGRGNSVHRPFMPEGRYILPGYDRNRPRVDAILGDELAAIARSAGGS